MRVVFFICLPPLELRGTDIRSPSPKKPMKNNGRRFSYLSVIHNLAVVCKKVIMPLLFFVAIGTLSGCATPAIQTASKPPAVVTDSGPFNATDYEIAAADFRREGKLGLAGVALERARQLRLSGDTNTNRTQFSVTVKDLEDGAVKFEAEGKYDLAREARDLAQRFRDRERIQPSPPPRPPRNRHLVL